MFDIGFSELLVIGVVALVVIGPERLPRVARTLGHLAGRLQRYVADVKADINREIEFDELRKMRDEVQKAAADIETSVSAEVAKTQAELDKTAEELNKSVQSAVEARPQEAAIGDKPQDDAVSGKPAEK
jgi:sec-independent protein translocase protein TatB